MRAPLFVTRQSLSSRTAIGVQTKLFLERFPDWQHIFWSGAEFTSHDSRSKRIESALFTRFAILKGESTAARRLRALGLSWWKDDQPNTSLKRRLLREYGQTSSLVYVSPLETKDAKRTRAVLEVLGRPFVLHLWDLLSDDQSSSEAMLWLLQHAKHVFCLSEAMIEHIAPLRPDATILRFSRKPSVHRALPPSTRDIRVALIGNCTSYGAGLDQLNAALRILREQGQVVRLLYVGREKDLKAWKSRFDEPVEVTGFLSADEERDRMLASCSVGFLPGPSESPSVDLRSKYSIPSRVLDFVSVGLPVVGTIHPESATATYLRTLGLADVLSHSTPASLAQRLSDLSDGQAWNHWSKVSLEAFSKAQDEPAVLKRWFDQASA